MSILSSFFASFSKPPPADARFAELARRLAEIESRLERLHQVTSLGFDASTARELRALLAEPCYGEPGRLERHGFKVWSQNEEDGIIEEIFRRIGVARPGQPGSFVEFGVSDGRECNTLKLLVEGWRGLWMESAPEQCEKIRRIHAGPIGEGRLELLQTAVTAENIDRLIAGSRAAAAGELDLLSIDIDGNDYHVLEAIKGVRPRVVVIEYNGKFPPPMDVVPPYDSAHVWDGSDYAGASLQAISNLAERRDYRLVGTNICGANAFFVRSDLVGNHFAGGGAAGLYNPARYWLTPGIVAGHWPGDRFGYTTDAALTSK
jgi:hypothetical protein